MVAKKTYWKDQADRKGYRSVEELFIKFWLDELEIEKAITDVTYEAVVFRLSEKAEYEKVVEYTTKKRKEKKQKIVKRKLKGSGHVYTPDFVFMPIHPDSERLFSFFHWGYVGGDPTRIYTDVKGGWMSRGDSGEFAVNRAWTFSKYGIWINKVVPEKLFKDTFAPSILRLSPITRKPTKYADYKTVYEFLGG